MAQFARPDADQAAGLWTTTPLWSKVDDDLTAQPSGDGVVITSNNNTNPDNADLRLSDVTDPAASTGHVLRVRWNKSDALGHNINAVAELWQGVPGSGTLVATLTVNGIGSLEQEDSLNLSAGQADAITDYADLYVRVSRQGDTGGAGSLRRSLVAEAVELEVPDAVAGPVALTGIAAGSSTTTGALMVDSPPSADGYVLFDGTADNHVQAPDHAKWGEGTQVSELDFRVQAEALWRTPGQTLRGLCVKFSAGSSFPVWAWALFHEEPSSGAGRLRFDLGLGGGRYFTLASSAFSTTAVQDNDKVWVRVRYVRDSAGSGNYQVTFWYSQIEDPGIGDWGAIGSAQSGTASTSNMNDNSVPPTLFGTPTGPSAGTSMAGKLFAAELHIAGTRQGNPDFRTTVQGDWSTGSGTDDHSNVWTINGSQWTYVPGVAGGDVPLAGTADGTSSASGILSGDVPLAGTSAGTSTASGVLSGEVPLAGSAAGSSTASGVLSGEVPLAASAAGSSTAAGVLTTEAGGEVALQAQADGTSSASGILRLVSQWSEWVESSTAGVSLEGTAAGSSSATGVLSGDVPLAGSSAGSSSASGNLTLEGSVSLQGIADGTSTASGTLSGEVPLAGSSAGSSTATSDLTIEGTVFLVGTSEGTSTASGVLSGDVPLQGAAAGSSTGAGDLSIEAAGEVDFQGTSAGTSTAAGTLSLTVGLQGLAEGGSSATGALERAVSLSGASNGASTAQGALGVLITLEGLSEGSSTAAGSLFIGSLAKPPLGPTYASFISASGSAVSTSGGTRAEWRL